MRRPNTPARLFSPQFPTTTTMTSLVATSHRSRFAAAALWPTPATPRPAVPQRRPWPWFAASRGARPPATRTDRPNLPALAVREPRTLLPQPARARGGARVRCRRVGLTISRRGQAGGLRGARVPAPPWCEPDRLDGIRGGAGRAIPRPMIDVPCGARARAVPAPRRPPSRARPGAPPLHVLPRE